MLLTDDYFFFRGIININYINKQHLINKEVNKMARKFKKTELKEKKTRQIA